MKINPAQVRGQGDNRWSGERAQTGGEADNEAKYESDGGGHSASLLRKYPWNIRPPGINFDLDDWSGCVGRKKMRPALASGFGDGEPDLEARVAGN